MNESLFHHSASSAIQLKKVSYRYPRTEEWALNELSLEVPLGSIFVITGPTGCGKTTLLRVVRDFQKEFGGELVGEIQILGQNLTSLEPSSLGLKMGAVFQNPAGQLHQLRVIDEIMSGPMYQGLPWEECQKRARDAIEAISVNDLLDRNPLKLSGGEQQKVGVTACLAMKCEILLLDEPFSYIEDKSAKKLLEILVNLRNQGRTIILVTHNLKQVIEHADHVALLDKGKCLYAGTPEQVLRSQDSRGILMPLLWPKADPVKKGDSQKGAVAWGELVRRRVSTQDCIETRADRPQAEPTWDSKKILVLRQVEYVYPDGTRGLTGVSLEILAGEILGIVGGNGSGKTTLAKASAGLLRPLRGELFISKLNAEKLQPWEIARQVGYVAQLPSEMLFADSVLEECAFGAKCLGLADPIQKARQALQLVGLLKYQTRHPDSLSHGERRLLTIAAILVNQPPVLILDEPELGLDVKSWESVASTIETLNQMGKTIVLISHDLGILAGMCDRLVLMKEGQIMRTSSPGEILSDLGRAEFGDWKHSPLFQAL